MIGKIAIFINNDHYKSKYGICMILMNLGLTENISRRFLYPRRCVVPPGGGRVALPVVFVEAAHHVRTACRSRGETWVGQSKRRESGNLLSNFTKSCYS